MLLTEKKQTGIQRTIGKGIQFVAADKYYSALEAMSKRMGAATDDFKAASSEFEKLQKVFLRIVELLKNQMSAPSKGLKDELLRELEKARKLELDLQDIFESL